MAFTVENIYDDVYSELQDDRMRVRWPEAEVLRYINDGVRVIVTERPPAGLVKTDLALAAGTLQQLPAGGIHLIDIPRNTGGVPVRRVNRDNLEADPDWHTQADSTVVYEFAYDPGINPRDFWVSPPAHGPGELSGTTYSGTSFDVSAQDNQPTGLSFSPDGRRMFVSGNFSDTIYQYDLSTPFSVATAVYSGVSYDVSAQETAVQSVAFSSDGLVMFIVGTASATVYGYTLSMPWDISSPVYASNLLDVSAQEANPVTMDISPDGETLIVTGASGRVVYQYSLSTAWDLTTGSYSSLSFSIAGETSAPESVFFSNDGTRLYAIDSSGGEVYSYDLSTAYTVSTAVYNGDTYDTSTETTNPIGAYETPDGQKLFIVDSVADVVFEYLQPSARVELWYSAFPTDSATGTDTVPLGDEYRSSLRHYVLARCFNKEAEYASNEARVMIHMKQFYTELGLYEKARAVGSRPEHKGIEHRAAD